MGRQLRLQRERSASNGCLVTTWRQREGGSEGGREREETQREKQGKGGREEIERVREKQGGGEREEKEKGDIHCN